MTVNIPENKAEDTKPQEKIETKETTQQTQVNEKPNNNSTTPGEPQGVAEPANEDPNWKAFREARKKDRADREAAEKRAADKEAEVAALKAAMEAAFSKSAPTPQAYQEYYGMQPHHDATDESEDVRLEKKLSAMIAAREAAAEKARLEREQHEYPMRLRQTYPDFNNIVSQDNLDYLDYHYPEISRTIQRLPEGYDKWSDTYHAVKKLVPNHRAARQDAARADANFNKPKSISSPTIMQPGDAAGAARLTEERRAANWQRMQSILKGVS